MRKESGDALRRVRKTAGLTQVQLTKRLGISVSLLSAWENGHIDIPIAYKDALKSILGNIDGVEFYGQREMVRNRTRGNTPLSRARVAMGMTQADLAEIIGTKQSVLSLWEHGLEIPERYILPILAVLGRGALGDEGKNLHATPPKNLKGKRFGRLVALNALPLRDGKYVIWRCRCDCGNECSVSSRHLRTGAVKSCGCLKVENLSKTPIGEKLGFVEETNLSRLRSNAPQRNSSTGVRGVSKTKDGRYEAYVYFQKHRYRAGFFNTLEEAAQARIEAWNRICKPTLDKYDARRRADQEESPSDE